MINPNPAVRLETSVWWEEGICWIGIFQLRRMSVLLKCLALSLGYRTSYIFENHCAPGAGPIPLLDGRHSASGVGFEKLPRQWCAVGVNFNVLVRQLLRLQSYPDSLRKWTMARSFSSTDVTRYE